MLVSLLMPTRGRKDLAIRSLQSVCETAYNPRDIEILLGVDEDDLDNAHAIIEALNRMPMAYQVLAFDPLGYRNLHVYDNLLAQAAQGQWLGLWNDDCLMETSRWDKFIEEIRHSFACLDPTISNSQPPFEHGLFPFVPKRWFNLVGYLSTSPQVDTYLCLVANALQCRYAAPFTIFHDRYDETGHNLDATYKARTYQTEAFYQSDQFCDQMNRDVQTIAGALGWPVTHLVRRYVPEAAHVG